MILFPAGFMTGSAEPALPPMTAATVFHHRFTSAMDAFHAPDYASHRRGGQYLLSNPLAAPGGLRTQCRGRGWPLAWTVRLVTVRLARGELEGLGTALVDETAYPTAVFGPVYGQCWGQETYYGRLKGRLDLEHGSGQTVAAVEQDFPAWGG